MERLAREKISLQQRLSTLKKDSLGKWEHLDWRGVHEDQGPDYESKGVSTDLNRPLNYRHSPENDEPNGPSNLVQPPKIDLKPGNLVDAQQPLSVTINNCHIG